MKLFTRLFDLLRLLMVLFLNQCITQSKYFSHSDQNNLLMTNMWPHTFTTMVSLFLSQHKHISHPPNLAPTLDIHKTHYQYLQQHVRCRTWPPPSATLFRVACLCRINPPIRTKLLPTKTNILFSFLSLNNTPPTSVKRSSS